MSTQTERYVESGKAAEDAVQWLIYDAKAAALPERLQLAVIYTAACSAKVRAEFAQAAIELLEAEPWPDPVFAQIVDAYLESPQGLTAADDYGKVEADAD